MSLEKFMEELDNLIAGGLLDEEIQAGLVLRIEISSNGIQVEGLRAEELCPRDIRAGHK